MDNMAPDFELINVDGQSVHLADYGGRWLVLYFYPKDNTSGCTREAVEFTAAIDQFAEWNCAVVGVSPDTVKKHQNFREKHGLKVGLLADPEQQALEAYGVWQQKKMYGREYMGVVRSTFLIDPGGIIRHSWSKVKVAGHVDEVLAKLKELKGESDG